jgi:hypothetical protein
MKRLPYLFVSAMVNPMLWVVLLAPVAVNVALRLVQADIVVASSVAQLPATSIPGQVMASPTPAVALTPLVTLETAIQSPHTHAILDYSLQIFTVILAFIFWIAYLFSDGIVKFAETYLHSKGEGIHLGTSGKAVTKCAWYFASALAVFLLTVLLFMQAGHLGVVALYEPTVRTASGYSSLLLRIWDAVGGPPPLSSPLTWARVLLTMHGLFRRSYQHWHESLGLS